jgi:hypothetical protein
MTVEGWSRYLARGVRTPIVINSYREIVVKYDGVILDQYGVLHNGATAFAEGETY